MRKSTIIISILALTVSFANAQLQFGAKFGIHSFDLNSPKDIISGDNNIMFSEAKIGFQGGIYTKIEIGGFFIEPRIMLNSTSVEYTFDGVNGGFVDNIINEQFTNLDIPLLLGFDVSILDLYAGPVAHIHINTSSDLIDFSEYKERFDTAQYGFRLGIGSQLGKISLGLEYEGNFSAFGDHISIAGQGFSFDSRPSRFIFNLGIRFF